MKRANIFHGKFGVELSNDFMKKSGTRGIKNNIIVANNKIGNNRTMMKDKERSIKNGLNKSHGRSIGGKTVETT
jgi:hypothetical protein